MKLKRVVAEATLTGALSLTILGLGTGVANAVPLIPWPQDLGGGNFGGGNIGGGNWVPDLGFGDLVPDINLVPDIDVDLGNLVNLGPPGYYAPPYVGGCVCLPSGCTGQC